MKAILAVTMAALLVLAGILIFQFMPQEKAAPVPAQASAPVVQPVEQAPASTPEPVVAAPNSTPQPVVSATAPAAEEVAEPEVQAADQGQIDESLLPQPNSYEMASITAAGREIGTMNRVEVMSALDNGADQMMALREQIKQAEEMGATEEVARLKGQHDALEQELLSLANHGVSLNKSEQE